MSMSNVYVTSQDPVFVEVLGALYAISEDFQENIDNLAEPYDLLEGAPMMEAKEVAKTLQEARA